MELKIMKILAIETAGRVCGVSLLEDDNLIKEAMIEDENTHSVKLMPLIDNVLKETNTAVQDIDLFACDKGPGSFTGIRIGISTIKAFADATNKKVIGITSLENLACYEQGDQPVATMLDAKNGNVYYGVFQRTPTGSYEEVIPSQFSTVREALTKIEALGQSITFVGDGCMVYQEDIKDVLGKKATFKKEHKLHPTHIGMLAYIKRNEATDTNHLVPTYLRKSNAERMLEENNKE